MPDDVDPDEDRRPEVRREEPARGHPGGERRGACNEDEQNEGQYPSTRWKGYRTARLPFDPATSGSISATIEM